MQQFIKLETCVEEKPTTTLGLHLTQAINTLRTMCSSTRNLLAEISYPSADAGRHIEDVSTNQRGLNNFPVQRAI